MELVLRGLQWKTLLIYLDDIIIFSSNLEEHLLRLEEVLKRLSEAKLKLKPSKCHLLETEVLFLGHIVGQIGVKPNPQLIKSVMDWKAPTSTKQVQQFLGLANYYRRFIKNFSDIAAPLSHLTKKDVKFQWTSDCQIAMEKLKLALCRAPVLAYPQPGGGYTLDFGCRHRGGIVTDSSRSRKSYLLWFKKARQSTTELLCHEERITCSHYFCDSI